MSATTTLTISINRPAQKVYDFVSQPGNLPKWARTFCKSAKEVKGKWFIETPQGPMKFRMADKNAHGVLDHYINPAPGVEMYVPMRVVAATEGSEVIFTLLRTPEMTDERYTEDIKWVKQDLSTLKKVMETN